MSGIHLALLGMNFGQPFTEIITFNGSATWTCPTGVTEVEYLVVAGGGGGGGYGGGGGAGGYRTASGFSVTAGDTYTVTVGAGGAAATVLEKGISGSNSLFSTITSAGGGGGGGSAAPNNTGINGGSGGGGGGVNATGGSGNTPLTSPSQGK
jgi:hypothetical protein